jgi:hypothetical protein
LTYRGGVDRAGARRGARADPDTRQARAQGGRAGGRFAGRRRIGPLPPADPRAPGANPGPFSLRSRGWLRSWSSRHVSQRGRARANVGGSPICNRDNSGNSAACTQSRGAVRAHARRPMGYPTPVHRCTLCRVARPAQHRGVADVERRTTSGQRHDVIDREVAGLMGGSLVAGAPVPMLTTPVAEHAGAEALPSPRAVQRVVAAAVRLSGVIGAAATRAAR